MSGERPRTQQKTIALIGLRGSGKTTVGRVLADLLDGECVDVDEVIQRESGCSISDLFEREGEKSFRRREREAIERIALSPPAVVSVGGGAPIDRSSAGVLAKMATIVWLTAPAQVLWERVSADPATVDSRPPLTDLNGIAELEELATQRFECYERIADFVMDTDGRTPLQIARAIIHRLDEAQT